VYRYFTKSSPLHTYFTVSDRTRALAIKALDTHCIHTGSQKHGRLQDYLQGTGANLGTIAAIYFVLRVDNRPTVVEPLVPCLLNFSVTR